MLVKSFREQTIASPEIRGAHYREVMLVSSGHEVPNGWCEVMESPDQLILGTRRLGNSVPARRPGM